MACAACSGGHEDQNDLTRLFDGDLRDAPRDRLVVAEVDGVEVYDDCVEAQAAAHQLSLEDAVAECIDFELLAAEAHRRGIALPQSEVDKEVVRSFIDREFTARFQDPSQLPKDKLQERFRATRRPEYRYVLHALAKLPPVAADDPREIGLKALIGTLAARFKGRTDVTETELSQAAKQASAQLLIEEYNFPRHNRAVEEFAAPVFAMTQAGTVIGPVRTKFGWHVILLTKIQPEQSYDEWAEGTFGELRRRAFEQWVERLIKAHKVDIDEPRLPELLAEPLPSQGGS